MSILSHASPGADAYLDAWLLSRLDLARPEFATLDLSKEHACGEEGAVRVANALTLEHVPQPLLHLNLTRCGIGPVGTEAIAAALKKKPPLQSLILAFNPGMSSSMPSLLAALRFTTSSLVELDLSFCHLGAGGAKQLAESLASSRTLQALNLHSTALGAEGAACVAELLLRVRTLVKVDLARCGIGNDGAGSLARCLPRSNLTSLSVRRNHIERGAMRALLDCLCGDDSGHFPKIAVLDVAMNGFSDALIRPLKLALEVPSSPLRDVDISGGGASFGVAVRDYGVGKLCAHHALLARTSRPAQILSRLILRNHEIGSLGATAIAGMMSLAGSNLRTLDMHGCCVGLEGVQAICRALRGLPPAVKKNKNTKGTKNDEDEEAEADRALAAQAGGSFRLPPPPRAGVGVEPCLTELNLHNNRIGSEAGQVLGEMLRVNHTLTALDVGGCGLGCEGCTAIVAPLAATNTVLRTLALDYNGIGKDGATALGTALRGNSALTRVDLSSNPISSAGFAALSETLRGNKSALRCLDLVHTRMGDAGLSVLATGIGGSRTIETLNIYGNGITQAGVRDLCNAARKNKEASRLREINLGKNKLSDVALEELASLLLEQDCVQVILVKPLGQAAAARNISKQEGDAAVTSRGLGALFAADQKAQVKRVAALAQSWTQPLPSPSPPDVYVPPAHAYAYKLKSGGGDYGAGPTPTPRPRKAQKQRRTKTFDVRETSEHVHELATSGPGEALAKEARKNATMMGLGEAERKGTRAAARPGMSYGMGTTLFDEEDHDDGHRHLATDSRRPPAATVNKLKRSAFTKPKRAQRTLSMMMP